MNVKTIGECFSYIKNGANIKQGVLDGGYPITRIETIADDQFNRDRMGYAGITNLKQYESYILEDCDLLMSHINSVQYLGRTVLYRKENNETILHGMNLLRLKPVRTLIDPSYARYFFYSRFFREQIGRITKKSVNQASFSISDLKNIKILTPSLEKQKRIAEALDKVVETKKQKEQIEKKFDDLIKARFVEMFGDPIRNSKNLPTDKISERYFLKAGITTSADEIHDYSEVYKTPCFGGNGVRGYVKSSTYSGEYPIIGRQGALCGNIQFTTGNFHATEHAVLVTILQNDNVLWVYYLLKFMDLNRFHTGAAQPGLSVKTLNTVDIITVDRKQQDEFASFAKQIDKSKVMKRLRLAHFLFVDR